MRDPGNEVVGVGVSSSDLNAASNGLTLSNSSIPYSRALRPALQLVLALLVALSSHFVIGL